MATVASLHFDGLVLNVGGGVESETPSSVPERQPAAGGGERPQPTTPWEPGPGFFQAVSSLAN